ncbi:MAG TPA: phasin family protein [Caulobacteraceae bacterium]|jgi:hypothetical protein|nr:phasin family protein [Caulobacteraceae bacterium]
MKKRVDHFDLAQRSAATARKAGEAMESAGHVIAARTEMAALAYANPSVATGIEMNLMVSEKVVALSEAGATLAQGAGDMAGHGVQYATEEVSAAGRYALALTTCRSPIELFALQGRLMSEFVTRGMAFGLGLNTLATRTGEQVMDPIHKTVTANHKRLKK